MTDEQNREQLDKEERRLEDLQKYREEIETRARGPSGKYTISDDIETLLTIINDHTYK